LLFLNKGVKIVKATLSDRRISIEIAIVEL
jgi:hypothetical protein